MGKVRVERGLASLKLLDLSDHAVARQRSTLRLPDRIHSRAVTSNGYWGLAFRKEMVEEITHT